MTQKTYTIAATYYAGTEANVTLPDGKTWDDVEFWYVKWDTIHIKFRGSEEYFDAELNSDGMDSIDWKRPVNATVFSVDAEGGTEYENEVASC